MSDIVLNVENLSKQYRLGEIGTGTISHDLNRWWAKVRGKEDPYSIVGQVNDRTQKAESDFVWALKDINFNVRQGEVLGIVGKNGAGKSTLLKLISRITAPTTGRIRAKGRTASLLEVGTGMHPEMTARENIYLNGAIMGMTKREITRKFDEIITFAGCAMYVDTPVKRFSSGMRVRLGFAVAAFLEPEILIIDEVLAVGDAEFQKKAVGKMKEVSQGEGRTILFVSHNMGAVKSLCTRTMIIEKGQLAREGQTDEMVSYYLKGGDSLGNRKIFDQNEHQKDGMSLKSISIKGKGKEYIETPAMDDALELAISYDNQSVRNDIHFTLRFKGEDGNFIFVTSTGDYEKVTVEHGQHTMVMDIPANFFNAGSFFVDLLVVSNKKILYSLVDIISFTINPKQVKLGEWMGITKGYLKPIFEWKTM